MRRLQTKYLLKRAARGLVPDRDHRQAQARLLQRALVAAGSPRSCAPPRRSYLLDAAPRYAEFLSRSAVARLVSAHERTRGASSQLLLRLLVLEVWLASFVPRAFGADEPTRALAVETG